jgi:hypothetical protein
MEHKETLLEKVLRKTRMHLMAVFGIGGAVLVAASVSVYGYHQWTRCCPQTIYNKICKIVVPDADLNQLSAIMRFPPTGDRPASARQYGAKESNLTGEFRPPLVPHTSTQRPYNGNEIISMNDYLINCMYPPALILGDPGRESVGSPIPRLPVYCDLPSYMPPSGKTVPKRKNYCPEDKETLPSQGYGVPPQELSNDCLRKDLALGYDAGSPSYLESVGALKVYSKSAMSSKFTGEFWASGFMIGTNLFATSCHALIPLFDKDSQDRPKIDPKTGRFTVMNDLRLVVDFSIGHRSDDSNSLVEFEATHQTCGVGNGVDVALLNVPGRNAPGRIPIRYEQNLGDLVKHIPATLVSYADLRHPFDQPTAEMYDPVANPQATTSPAWHHLGYWKFAMWNPVAGTAKCQGVEYLLDYANTTVGSSGAVVLDVFKETSPFTFELRERPLAVGMHKCCSAYFDEAYTPEPALNCAWLQRTPFNQDVSTTSIIKDPGLCGALNGKADIEDGLGNQYDLVCGAEVKLKRRAP